MEEIPPSLDGWNLDYLDRTEDTVCAIDRDGVIVWTNPAWEAFAAANGGTPKFMDEWAEGASYLQVIPEPLKRYFERFRASCARQSKPRSYDYECSSPALYRKFRQTIYPTSDDHVVIVNSRVVEQPHAGPSVSGEPIEADYRDEAGNLRQCMECRRVSHATRDRWDWIPEWVRAPRRSTSDVLCPPCLDRYGLSGDTTD